MDDVRHLAETDHNTHKAFFFFLILSQMQTEYINQNMKYMKLYHTRRLKFTFSVLALLHISIPLVLPGGPGWPGWPGGPGIYALEASTFSPVICLLRSAALFGSKATCQEKKKSV